MSLDSIVEVMGGPKNIGRDIHNTHDFILASREGISVAVIKVLQSRIGLTNKMMSSILEISESTLQRLIKQKSRLGKSESEAAYEISKIIAKGIEVFGDEQDFTEWLNTKNIALGDERPIDWLDSSIGREQLVDLLVGIQYGHYS
ncbi:antitoxin Xre/MbcA/ParS toxin-binding domain-containing protein [Pontibacter sp. SGAir0037]|uniref:type II RES/Xre toxin-antitoxin system antitoxin n=1 Tax=Pontibacter sp. SGAir0037 TaxID=2571030 RepID=UPI001F107097|nr:antitoxin Xre/MbcA/ParS toxin-binding domain-containing protein [Pontibacter sp. SGAir0037]